MKILELFAGSQSFSKVARELGFQTFTSDIIVADGIDYSTDIMEFDVNTVPFVPDLIWASPDCATWSIAAGKTHFDKRSLAPKTKKAEIAFLHIDKTISIINYFAGVNEKLIYFIENPVGRLRWYLQAGTVFSKLHCRVVTVNQSDYGREFKKPTDLFTNSSFVGRKKVLSGTKRIREDSNGYKNWRADNKGGYYNRALIAPELCKEILNNL